MNRQDAKVAKQEPDLLLDALAHDVIGAAIEVHRILGPGYLENVYEQALAKELELRGIPFARQNDFSLDYKGSPVGKGRLDFLVNDKLVLEIKATDSLAPIHKAQVISYLKATGSQLGLLINFNEQLLKNGIQRVVLS